MFSKLSLFSGTFLYSMLYVIFLFLVDLINNTRFNLIGRSPEMHTLKNSGSKHIKAGHIGYWCKLQSQLGFSPVPSFSTGVVMGRSLSLCLQE